MEFILIGNLYYYMEKKLLESVAKHRNSIFFLDLFDKLFKLINTWL